LGVLTRLVRVHSKPGDKLLDFFAGSGSFGDAAARFGRDVVLIDESDEAIAVMQRRFAGRSVTFEDEAGDPIVPATGRHSSVGAHDELSTGNAGNEGHDGASADVDGTGHVDQTKVQHDPRALPVIPVETSAADGAAAGAPPEEKENRTPSRLATRGNPKGAQGSLF
jgi:hypothetical protein